jgi:hypothetical protein
LFLAAYARIQSQLTRRTNGVNGDDESKPDHVIIGVYLANRGYDLEGLADLTAPTVNIVPLRIDNAAANGESLFSVAQRVQKDMQEIGRIEYSGVSLAEIADWTGVRVDTCVNFLRLPESGQAQKKGEGQQVQVEPADPQEIEGLLTENDCNGNPKKNGLAINGQTPELHNKHNSNPERSEFLADIFKVCSTIICM